MIGAIPARYSPGIARIGKKWADTRVRRNNRLTGRKYFAGIFQSRIFAGLMNKERNIVIHVIGCALFLLLPFLFSPEREGGRLDMLFSKRYFIRDLSRYLLVVIFFYLNYYILVSRLYLQKKYLWYGLIVTACFLLIALLPSSIIPDRPFSAGGHFSSAGLSANEPPPGMRNKPPPRDFFSHINHNFFLFFAVLLFSLLLRIGMRWRQSEKEKLNAELSYLKAQINPHFLFNTLNSIYSLAIEKSDNAAPAVAKLSAMMRYVISDAEKEFVPLDKEIAHINSYIDLQRIRFNNNVNLVYEVEGNMSGKRIAPLILVPFIENAFKYGVNAEENAMIVITIRVSADSKLNMIVENNKVKTQNPGPEKTGMGLANTKNRLQLLYPGNHILAITENETRFAVSLTILLQ